MAICFQYLVYMYLGVELLVHMVTLCLTFWETAKLLSKTTIFYFPSAVFESCNFFTSSPTSIFCCCCSSYPSGL